MLNAAGVAVDVTNWHASHVATELKKINFVTYERNWG